MKLISNVPIQILILLFVKSNITLIEFQYFQYAANPKIATDFKDKKPHDPDFTSDKIKRARSHTLHRPHQKHLLLHISRGIALLLTL